MTSPIKNLKKYIVTNKKLYLLSVVILLVGALVGGYLVLGELIDAEVYASADMELSEIILGERGFMSLLLQNLWALVVPLALIFLLFISKYTKVLSFFYLGYQGLLLGASIVSLISDSGLAGALNSILLIIPINFVNFFVLISWIVTCYKRLAVARVQHLSFGYSLRVFGVNFLTCLAGALFASIVYAFTYPLLLRSAIVVNI